MKVVALVSGGKDSCYAMMRCIDYGHEIVALANLLPDDDSIDDLDSYMYQTVGHQVIASYAECMGLPLFRRRIRGSPRHKDLQYKVILDDEVEDMYVLLNEVKHQIPLVQAVCSGAIASDYQRLRVESVCSRLNLVSLAYLWKQDQTLLLQEMVKRGILAIIIKVAAMGLKPGNHLGKAIEDMQPLLLQLKEIYGINVCGEGGEYESLTLDCPLFKNARIVLDNFQIVFHSTDSIAPAGVLHPLSFHVERKYATPISSGTETCETISEKMVNVHDVKQQFSFDNIPNLNSITLACELEEKTLHISRTKGRTFSLGCWISSSSCKDLQEDMTTVLRKIELRLGEDDLGWENVLYIHMYISDMRKFTLANEVYLKFISEQNCHYGVPSRSTVELPLKQVGLGNVYIEVLASKDPRKRVLHVQSISCWAPSCIGPYSQATLQKEILFMAGQLGLDPPTMLLHTQGAASELDQALKNCEAVAECFGCSIASSSILLVIYCSASLTLSERIDIQHRQENFVANKIKDSPDAGIADAACTICIYVLAPELPKRAHVEVKPILYVPNHMEAVDLAGISTYPDTPQNWNFGLSDKKNSCIQKFIVTGKICAAVVSITSDVAAQICSVADRNSAYISYCDSEEHLRRISRFCLCLLHHTLAESTLSWSHLLSLRVYVPTSFCVNIDMLNVAFCESFAELAENDHSIQTGEEPIFTMVPVLSSGRSASMNDLVTCELLASKS